MANELKIDITFDFKGTANGQGPWKRKETFFVTPAGESFIHSIQTVGTSEEELTQHADVGTPGWCFVKNLDSVNYIELGGVTGQYTVRLKAGESCIFRLTTGSLFALANTASCQVEYIIFE